MTMNPNDLRGLMSRVMGEAVEDGIATDSEADELERVFNAGMNSLGYM